MQSAALAIFVLHALIAIAFTLAFMIPLGLAGSEARSEAGIEPSRQRRLADSLGFIADVWLFLRDSIPIFWLLIPLTDTPDDIRAAKVKWKSDETVRLCFWVAVPLIVTLPLYAVFL